MNFYPRSPCGERLVVVALRHVHSVISIHALLAESDSQPSRPPANRQTFLSTLSLRRATWLRCWQLAARDISIHALLAESDYIIAGAGDNTVNFYPRSPCGERPGKVKVVDPGLVFLSTLSLRRATLKPPVKSHRQKHFYPRSPCGERPTHPISVLITVIISIHALLAESDRIQC